MHALKGPEHLFRVEKLNTLKHVYFELMFFFSIILYILYSHLLLSIHVILVQRSTLHFALSHFVYAYSDTHSLAFIHLSHLLRSWREDSVLDLSLSSETHGTG